MAIIRLDALCECEGCQKQFGIEIDIAQDFKPDVCVDFDEIVRETIRNGDSCGYRWGVRGQRTVDRMALSYNVTIQADLMLCDECSRKCDALPIEGNLTRAQVNEALGLPRDET